MNKVSIFSILLLLANGLSGCAQTRIKTLRIESDPPGAPVSIDGNYIGKTPTEKRITCQCSGDFGCDKTYSWTPKSISVQALPSSLTGSGYVQNTTVNDPCFDEDLNKAVFFNMKLKRAPLEEKVDWTIKHR